MYKKPEKTKFAPAERADQMELANQMKLFEDNEILKNLSEAVSNMLVILNKQRQIIYANKLFLNFLGVTEKALVLGKRTGEAANCIHAGNNTGGCGASEFCRTCGAVNAILESQQGGQSTKECRIITTEKEALDLKVTATPYSPNGEMFTIFAVNDISHEKRRQTLERIFFHDVLNSANGITGLSEVIQQMDDPNEITEIAQLINRSASSLVEEIVAQRNIGAAERNDYELNYTQTNTFKILNELSELYSRHEVIVDKHITIEKSVEDIVFYTDSVLLRRILGNMIKNALEATLPKGTVTLNCATVDEDILFSVHNNNYIERETQLQLFKRSFSTKGVGRGIGTYSMKLFGEKYLKGKVWFESNPESGTTFFVKLPIEKP